MYFGASIGLLVSGGIMFVASKAIIELNNSNDVTGLRYNALLGTCIGLEVVASGVALGCMKVISNTYNKTRVVG